MQAEWHALRPSMKDRLQPLFTRLVGVHLAALRARLAGGCVAVAAAAQEWAKRLNVKPLSPFMLEPIYRVLARWLTFLVYRPRYEGFERIPLTGPGLLIANHVSYVDGMIIAAGIHRPVRFVIDDTIYRLPGVHYFMRLNRAIPIAPRRDSVEAALAAIAEGLAQGDMICIFPEGQLTYTGSLGRFRPGIEWILKRSPVMVYPLALTGLWGSVFSRKYLKARWRWMPRRFLGWSWSFGRGFGGGNRPVRAVCGDPIPPEQATVNTLQRVVLQLKHQARYAAD